MGKDVKMEDICSSVNNKLKKKKIKTNEVIKENINK